MNKMTVKGLSNSAEVFTDAVDHACLDQLRTLLNCAAFEGERIRIMPDAHAGVGCVVGYTQTVTNGRVVPGLVGCDLGCGVAYVPIPEVDLRALDQAVHRYVPAGFEVHRPGALPGRLSNGVDDLLNRLHTPLRDKARARALCSLGTLGGGNHYIEVDCAEASGQMYLVVHTGSRNLGLQVFEHWRRVAAQKAADNHRLLVDAVTDHLRAQGLSKDAVEDELRRRKPTLTVPRDLAFLTGADLQDYLHDVAVCQEFADRNRRRILEVLTGKLGVRTPRFAKLVKTTLHNYVDLDRMIVRKGAVRAEAGEELIIPLNMRDGALLCVGAGSAEHNYSAPHGAGRALSRRQARALSMDAYRAAMAGVYTSSVSEATLDESPMAYKDPAVIEAALAGTAEVVAHLKPVYNFKAGGGE